MPSPAAEPLHPTARGLTPPAARAPELSAGRAVGRLGGARPQAWPRRVPRRYRLIPTICFNCEAACGLLTYVDRETHRIQKFEGNPEHPGSRGRNCAKGPATLNQVEDPERIRYPLKRVGPRGGGQWQRVSWSEALDDLAARIRKALQEGRQNEVMYHVGRPGHELVYHQRILHAWGIDGHNSHTNVCSASARAGYAFWSGLDRPSPDHANARFILLLSSHLETGHYFNPHAQRIIEGKKRGAKVCAIDTRLSNTASMADWWLSPWPGTEAALLLAMCQLIIAERRYDREFLRRWVNWAEYLREEHPDKPPTFETFEALLPTLYAEYTPEFAERESGVPAATIVEVAREAARAGSALATHVWRNAAAGNLGGWQVARALQLLVVLVGAVATPGGTAPSFYNKAIPAPPLMPPPAKVWSELLYPPRVPARVLRDELPPAALLREGRGRLDTYFTRVYNPVWTNPDGFSWIEMLTDEAKVGCPRVPDADLERDRVVRRLRPADGPRLRAARPHEPGDPRGALDRLPAAGAAGRPRARGQAVRHDVGGARRGRAGRGVGGGRVLDRAVLADRPRRGARDPEVVRVAVPARREADRGRLLRLDVRALGAGAAGGRGAGGPHPARLHAEARRLPRRGRRLPDARDDRRPGGPRGGLGRSRHRADHQGRRGDRRRDRRPGARRLPDALAQARVLLEDAPGLEVAGVRAAGLHPEPRPLVADRPRQGRVPAAADVPAADA